MKIHDKENVSKISSTPPVFYRRKRTISSNSKTEDSAEESHSHRHLKKQSSFKQICQFPVAFYRRGSKDFMTWVNGLTITRASTLSIVEHYYKQIQPSFIFIIMTLAVFVLGLEVCLCLTLVVNLFFETGFTFLLLSFAGVCLINMTAMAKFYKYRTTKHKLKSKEI